MNAVLLAADGARMHLQLPDDPADRLTTMQHLVGGYLEAVTMRDRRGDLVGYINEDGKAKRLPVNDTATDLVRTRLHPGDVIVGAMVILRCHPYSGADLDLTDAQITELVAAPPCPWPDDACPGCELCGRCISPAPTDPHQRRGVVVEDGPHAGRTGTSPQDAPDTVLACVECYSTLGVLLLDGESPPPTEP